ncbi:Proteasome subunit beta type-5 [Mycoemilia scoparia]|uniref:Proteasome subunit beta n=1 Tax=Mycoemilia scoparia TaxID=417184 RepID=A0A9W7ZVE3_9FUNG|nr:Proteasome subunit beta type-5 [Mycoemilia scoparia]
MNDFKQQFLGDTLTKTLFSETEASATTNGLGSTGSGFETTAHKFALAPLQKPVEFAKTHIDNTSETQARIQAAHGTTTLAFKFQHGVIVCTDSRATMGNVIASQTVKKVIEINEFLLGTMAGGAADCSFWERELGRQCKLYALRNKKRITVAGASKILRNMVLNYKGMGLSMGTMICGWDEDTTDPALFYVDSDGQRLENHLFSVGSGSTFAYSVLDAGYHYNMEVEEAKELARRAIYHATYRDAFSGGYVRMYHIKQDGWVAFDLQDVGELDIHYYPERKGVPDNQVQEEIIRPAGVSV